MKKIVTFVGNYKRELGGLLRHAATIVGGVLIAKGSLTTDSFTMILGGTSSILGTGWSFANKLGQKKAVRAALATDPVTGDVTRHFNEETKTWEKEAPTA
jgi:isocitrate dehydrogenase